MNIFNKKLNKKLNIIKIRSIKILLIKDVKEKKC